MSEEIQSAYHCLTGQHPALAITEVGDILRLTIERRAQHEIIDANWTRETIAAITYGRIPDPPDSLIGRFGARAGWPIRRIQVRTPKDAST
jgi:hypothetical protein